MAEWQPIGTAPKDGTKVDLGGFYANGRFVRAPDCYWHKRAAKWITHWQDKTGYSALRLPFAIAYWAPLPQPPEQS